MKQFIRLADLPTHESGLRLMERDYSRVPLRERHVIDLPECCPVSKNPKPGSTVTLSYVPKTWVLEVYSLRALVGRFQGGLPKIGKYGPEQNMEGMIQLLAQMAADALGVPVRARASLVLDAGGMSLTAVARPE